MIHFAIVQNDPLNNLPAFTRTRIAPTPSGYLHLGNVLSFVITAALAEYYGARILLRIDDMDRERYDPKYVQDIFDTLRFLEIPWHEGPTDMSSLINEYSQIHRLELYHSMLATLEEQHAVFACDCSRSQLLKQNKEGHYTGNCRNRGLSLRVENTCWRMLTDDRPIPVNTLQGITWQTLPPSVQYFIVKKKDGYPAYQLSSLADDLHFDVDLIVRGEDLFPSTLAQHFLALQLDKKAFLQSTFHHHPLIKDIHGLKLSKSAGATSIYHLRKEGKKPSDVFTLIGHLIGFRETIPDRRALTQLLQCTS